MGISATPSPTEAASAAEGQRDTGQQAALAARVRRFSAQDRLFGGVTFMFAALVLVREEAVYNPHQYTGRQYDAESGLYHYRARAYSPDIGRFMQQDPAGMVDGPNLYAYVGNNPVNRRDPSGMWLENPAHDCWEPGRINPRTGEPVPIDMYIDFNGEYKECPVTIYDDFVPGLNYLLQPIGGGLVSTYEFLSYWLWELKRFLSPAPGPGFDWHPPVTPIGPYNNGAPHERYNYMGIGTIMNILHW